MVRALQASVALDGVFAVVFSANVIFFDSARLPCWAVVTSDMCCQSLCRGAYRLQLPLTVSSQWCSPLRRSSFFPPGCDVGLRCPLMCATGVHAVDAAVDVMVLISSVAFPADSKFLASGSVVEVVRAYRLQLSFMLSSNWCSSRMRSF